MDARETALLTLNACERQGGWSDGALKKQISAAGLDSRDAALATQLCAGVLQNPMLLDFYLAHFSNIPLKRMEGRVVQALRLGAYQMLFLDRIPHSAAVNRSVELTRAYCKNPRAAGMVNGILRSLERSLERLPTIPQRDPVEYLSILYSHPAWMVREFLLTLGNDGAAALLRANNAQPATAAQVNTLKINARELRLRLEERGVRAEKHPWLTDCILLSGTGNLEELPEFQAGLFYIQDPASRLAVAAAGPAAGMRVLDACAAPGGKSFAAAIAMGGRGTVCSCDLHPHKKKLIANGAARLGLDCVTPMTADACVHRPEWEGAFDLVLVDAPCSGLGVIRKKPDIRYKDPEPLAALPSVQRRILENVSSYVRPGGTLLYSTCTLLRRENENVVSAFLEAHPQFGPEPFQLPGVPGAEGSSWMLTLWPHIQGTDGFFISRMKKREEAL